MKATHTLAILAVPTALASVIAFHPGHAFAESRLRDHPAAKIPVGTYKVDPMHAGVGFEIGHFNISKIQGRFNKFDATIKVDPDNLSASNVEFVVQTESVDTAVVPRDTHLRSADFFEVAKYPEMRFKSTNIREIAGGFLATGDLTIKETTKPVSIRFKQYGPIVNEQGTRVGFVADPFIVNRLDYGVGADQKMPDGVSSISPNVRVKVSIEALLQK